MCIEREREKKRGRESRWTNDQKKNKKRFEEFQGQSTEKNPKKQFSILSEKSTRTSYFFFKKKFDVDVKFAYIKFQIKLFDVKIRFFQEWEESKRKRLKNREPAARHGQPEVATRRRRRS